MEEMLVEPIVATEEPAVDPVVAELERRVRELEAAIGDLRTVKAAGVGGRKTSASLMAKGAEVSETGGIDEALRSLSVEQRIAVKSGLMRAGVL